MLPDDGRYMQESSIFKALCNFLVTNLFIFKSFVIFFNCLGVCKSISISTGLLDPFMICYSKQNVLPTESISVLRWKCRKYIGPVMRCEERIALLPGPVKRLFPDFPPQGRNTSSFQNTVYFYQSLITVMKTFSKNTWAKK